MLVCYTAVPSKTAFGVIPVDGENLILHSTIKDAQKYFKALNKSVKKYDVIECIFDIKKHNIFSLKRTLHRTILSSILPNSIVINGGAVLSTDVLKEQLYNNEVESSILAEPAIINILKTNGYDAHIFTVNNETMYYIYDVLKTLTKTITKIKNMDNK